MARIPLPIYHSVAKAWASQAWQPQNPKPYQHPTALNPKTPNPKAPNLQKPSSEGSLCLPGAPPLTPLEAQFNRDPPRYSQAAIPCIYKASYTLWYIQLYIGCYLSWTSLCLSEASLASFGSANEPPSQAAFHITPKSSWSQVCVRKENHLAKSLHPWRRQAHRQTTNTLPQSQTKIQGWPALVPSSVCPAPALTPQPCAKNRVSWRLL